MQRKSVWIGEIDNILTTESWVISSKTLSCPHHRHQFLCYTRWLKAPSVHSLQSIAADRANNPSCLYIQLLWSKGDMTWHLVRDLSKFQSSDVKIPVLGSLVAEVGRAFEFGSQSGPQSCDVPRSPGFPEALYLEALSTVSSWASITALNF